jgi:hypothetical protein
VIKTFGERLKGARGTTLDGGVAAKKIGISTKRHTRMVQQRSDWPTKEKLTTKRCPEVERMNTDNVLLATRGLWTMLNTSDKLPENSITDAPISHLGQFGSKNCNVQQVLRKLPVQIRIRLDMQAYI